MKNIFFKFLVFSFLYLIIFGFNNFVLANDYDSSDFYFTLEKIGDIRIVAGQTNYDYSGSNLNLELVGQGEPESQIQIQVANSMKLVNVDASGKWIKEIDFQEGSNKIEIINQDRSITLSYTLQVDLNEEADFAQAATDSDEAQVSGTIEPTSVPTKTITETPTSIPQITKAPKSTDSNTPVTGNVEFAIIISLLGLGFLGGGIYLLKN